MRLARHWVLAVVMMVTAGAATATAQEEDAAARFEQLFAELQEKTERAQELRAQYEAAEAGEREALAEQFNALVDELNAMTPALSEATIAAYKAAPNEDEEVTNTLAMVAQNLIASDRFEQARQATRLMVEHEHPERQRFAMAGMAAFAVGDFEEAEQFFEQAKEEGAMPRQAMQFASSVEDYLEYAERERRIREAEAEADDLPRVRMRTTEGEMVIELFEDHAPNTVANFITLVEDGFYDDVVFHRVLPNFMAQGGDPTGTGGGGPGYAIECELDGEYRHHFRGTLSMAHAGEDTGGSQFFLTFLPTPHLNGRHTAFGRVIEGMDVLAELNRVNPQRPQPNVEPSRIIEAQVIRKRDHDYEVEKLPSPR